MGGGWWKTGGSDENGRYLVKGDGCWQEMGVSGVSWQKWVVVGGKWVVVLEMGCIW